MRRRYERDAELEAAEFLGVTTALQELKELRQILADIWERRATVHEAGNGYEVVLDGELCERIRRVLRDWR